MGKVVGGFGKKSCVSTGVRKPGNTYASPTAMIWTLAVKSGIKPQYNQPIIKLKLSSASSFSLEESKICCTGKG